MYLLVHFSFQNFSRHKIAVISGFSDVRYGTRGHSKNVTLLYRSQIRTPSAAVTSYFAVSMYHIFADLTAVLWIYWQYLILLCRHDLIVVFDGNFLSFATHVAIEITSKACPVIGGAINYTLVTLSTRVQNLIFDFVCCFFLNYWKIDNAQSISLVKYIWQDSRALHIFSYLRFISN